ncbi:hypothetical protein CABS01_09007 [Colletotrichum abscissum]|uniref:Uncharacterized protein n=1 Tax=Colletotrichum abscissum TaxID=1671311 RepID=A0A9P9X6J1_9PEZI|nr:uncharacterized protein CABS01_09007 [Colletotrichum abscissum]KAI3539096.1 hypothetical protein CABS02_11517 [Colletotrichum abscissum]KAK1503618.1 hypothetical protein CABS01_09007 [Colletotrichum abscissum]
MTEVRFDPWDSSKVKKKKKSAYGREPYQLEWKMRIFGYAQASRLVCYFHVATYWNCDEVENCQVELVREMAVHDPRFNRWYKSAGDEQKTTGVLGERTESDLDELLRPKARSSWQ